VNATTNSTYSKPVVMRKRIGSTVYVINVYLKNDAAETMDDKILRLIKKDLNLSAGNGMMEWPQTGRLSERSSA
jgi:hypothetical protein